MPVAEIITIGTELLLGEIQDTNTCFLARNLREIGVDLYRTTMVGDNAARIAQTIREALLRCEIILITGGLGPTVDDPTRQAVADALDVDLVFHPDLWKSIEQRFLRVGRKASENNRRQAYIPKGADVIPNPVGSAPAFIARQDGKSIICLPGVPHEMERIYLDSVQTFLSRNYELTSVIRARVLHVVSLGESLVDEAIGELEKQTNPTVGLTANPGQVDIRLTAKGSSIKEVNRMLAELESIICNRLGETIYGRDDETLEGVVLNTLTKKDLSANLYLFGIDARLGKHTMSQHHLQVVAQPDALSLEKLQSRWQEINRSSGKIVLMANLHQDEGLILLEVIHTSSSGDIFFSRYYSGPPQTAPQWAECICLDTIRRLIIQ